MSELETQPQAEPANTTEAAPEAAPEQNPEGTESQENKPKPNGFQKRIDKLTREKYELQGRLKAYEEYRQSQQPEQRQEAESDGNEDPQTLIRREAEKVGRQLYQQNEQARQRETTAKEWKAQEADARKKYADYDDVIPEFVESWQPRPYVEAAILESDRKVDVTYYLATHPDEADALNSMSPYRAVAAIGKIEAKLETPPALKRQSAAPGPIAPVKTMGRSDDALGDDLSPEDWLKRRNSQLRKR